MPMQLRKLALTAHVTFSVGWLGAVAVFLALAVTGLRSADPQIVRAMYSAMELTGWFVIVPLAFLTLPSGLVMSLGTEWGLFRHYWIVAKLVITVLATILLLVHMQPVGHLARAVAETTLASGELAGLRLQLVADAGAALIALLAATVLSVYKPRGLTAYGRSVGSRATASGPRLDIARRRWTTVLWAVAIVFVVLFVLRHLMGGGMGNH